MNNDASLRKHLLCLLVNGEAHANFEAAVRDMPPALRGKRPPNSPHSPWEILEHMRIVQWDILEYIRDTTHASPEFPDGYWPAAAEPLHEHAWEETAAAFRADLKSFTGLLGNPSTDLFAALPGSEGHTILRELLLVADHNAYHLGELVLLRRLLGAWH
jgi:hypothetical protein